MKKSLFALFAIAAFAVANAHAQYAHGQYSQTQYGAGYAYSPGSSLGMSLRGGAVIPRKSKEWDVGGTFEMGLIFWGAENIGLWLGGGAQGWSATEDFLGYDADGSWANITGRTTVAPLGGSILLWGDLGNGLAIQFEGGLRYAIVDSNVRVQYGVPLQGGYSAVYESPIETDDTVLAIAALQIEYIADNWRLGFGGGYQWDIGKPKQTFLGEPLEDADFSAGLVFATLSFVF